MSANLSIKPLTMNTPRITESKPNRHLLDTIGAIRASVGEGLNDDEFTRLLLKRALLTEAGFVFLSLSEGFVTLSVPEQDLASWYPEKGWITAEKERIAGAIAQKYELLLGEPPDETSSFLFPGSDSPNVHHHLELRNRRETIVIAHPHYLKIRLFSATSTGQSVSDARRPVLLGPDLLQDLSVLYQA
jgi:hypothetical protein